MSKKVEILNELLVYLKDEISKCARLQYTDTLENAKFVDMIDKVAIIENTIYNIKHDT